MCIAALSLVLVCAAACSGGRPATAPSAPNGDEAALVANGSDESAQPIRGGDDTADSGAGAASSVNAPETGEIESDLAEIDGDLAELDAELQEGNSELGRTESVPQ
jgi:hypothetical protein